MAPRATHLLSAVLLCACGHMAAAQLGSRVLEGERWLKGEELRSGLRHLRAQFAGAGDGSFLPHFRPGAMRLPSLLGQSGASGGAGPVLAGECGAIKDNVLSQIQLALQMSLAYNIQDGMLDFGFLGTQNETDACAGQTCAYTNPSSPYGLTILPLSPNETVAQKLQLNMPDFARKDIQQRNGLPEEQAALLRRRQQAQQAAVAAAAKKLSASQQRGLSSSWQLAGEEVVLVAGCLPPATASRYFAFTPYLHSLMDDRVNKWVSVFASLGDSIGLYQRPGSQQGSTPLAGSRNRLNSSLPSVRQRTQSAARLQWQSASADGVEGAALGRLGANGLGQWLRESGTNSSSATGSIGSSNTEDAIPWVVASSGRSTAANEDAAASDAAGGTHGNGLWAGLLKTPAPTAQGDDVYRTAGSSNSSSTFDAGNTPPTLFGAASEARTDPYGQFSVVLMTASADSARRVSATLSPLLALLGLAGSLNLLPISAPFTDTQGLGEYDSYFMLITRSILGEGQMPAFKQYMQGQPWRVWRISPRPNTMGFGLLPLSLLAPAPFDATKQGFPPASVVPRVVAHGQQQSEEWLRPAMYWLLQQVDDRLAAQDNARSWSLGSDSGLGGAGIEWGIDCYTKRIDFCNGDNRDAQYITSIPMATLDRQSKVLYIVGVNHVASGLASYVNIAPSDPIQRLGLLSWDNQEMRGSADAYMAGGPYEGLGPLFYVIAYSRNCTGIPYCKEVPVTGARSLPLSRGMLVLLRAYVNPLTGVGPNSDDMVNFRTVVATPKAQALPRDTKPLVVDNKALGKSPCKFAIITAAVACSQTLAAAATPAKNSTRRETVRVLPTIARVGRSLDDSLCCNATASWAANQCWCNAPGQQMLDALSPLPARAMLVGVARACSHPVCSQLSACT